MSDRLPSLPLFVDDYEGATTHLTLEEDGAYMRLLRLCWRTPRCTIPDDPEWIMRRLRVDRETFDRLVAPLIDEFFKRARGRIYQKRLLQEYAYAVDRQKKRSEAGKKGGSAKAQKTNGKDASKRTALPEQTQGIAVAPSPAQPIPLEEQNSADANASTGAEAPRSPPTAEQIKKAVFDSGKALLTTAGHKDPGGMIQRWRRTYSDGVMLDVLTRCAGVGPEDPLPWIAAALQNQPTKANGNGNHDIRTGREPGPDRRNSLTRACDDALDFLG